MTTTNEEFVGFAQYIVILKNKKIKLKEISFKF